MQLLKRLILQAMTRGVMEVLALPDRVLRPLAGRPIRVDGNELSATAQVLIKLERMVPRKDPHLVTDVTAARAEFDVVMGTMLAGTGRRVATRDIELDGADGPLPARIYLPPNATGLGPAMVFFHGGGFVIGSIESHDAICRFLCERSGVHIISVGYRLAPENPFPAAADDAVSASCHVAKRPERYGAKPGRVGVGGDILQPAVSSNRSGTLPRQKGSKAWPIAHRTHGPGREVSGSLRGSRRGCGLRRPRKPPTVVKACEQFHGIADGG